MTLFNMASTVNDATLVQSYVMVPPQKQANFAGLNFINKIDHETK
jgi:hypothetical protein